MSNAQTVSGELITKVVSRVVAAFLILGAMFFLPAGTFFYWEAWLYLAILFIPMLLVMAYLIKNSPDLLERRMRMREKETQQKRIIKVFYFYFLVVYLLPGFDERYGWSLVPPMVVIVADIMVLAGYGLFFLVLQENRYASRIIEVEQQQEIITTGPYTVVRHPMYVAISLIYIFSPLALGSYWAMIPAGLIIIILAARILNEEQVLRQDLKGYQNYTQKTRYRLIPGLW